MPTKEVFSEWGSYFHLAIPSMLMLCAEWWAFEIITIMSGYLGVDEQAVIVVLHNLSELIFMLMVGFQQAACISIGNSLGENRPKLAKKYFFLTLAISTAASWTLIFIIFLFRSNFATLYFAPDEKPQLNAMLANGIAVMCACYVCDLIQGYLQGPIRGLGL